MYVCMFLFIYLIKVRCITKMIWTFVCMFIHTSIYIGVQVGRMGYVPAYGGNGNSRNVSCSKSDLQQNCLIF